MKRVLELMRERGGRRGFGVTALLSSARNVPGTESVAGQFSGRRLLRVDLGFHCLGCSHGPAQDAQAANPPTTHN